MVFAVVPVMIVVMAMIVMMMLTMIMGMPVVVLVLMVMSVGMGVLMFGGRLVLVFEVDVELGAGDVRALLARHVEVITVEPELLQFVFKLMRVDAQVNQRTNEHVTADAAEDVEVKRFHGGRIQKRR